MTPQKRILIVDDDRDYLEAVSCFLEANRFTVLKARSGEEAMRLAKMERPDLILMDIIMGERTEGLFTVQQIRRTPELKGVPIFVCSSLYDKVPDFRTAPESAWMAQDEFLAKPVDMAQLLEKIRRRVGEAA